MRQGKWEDAVAAFRECVGAAGRAAAAFHNLAYALERLGRYDEAQTALDEAVRARRRERPAHPDVARRARAARGRLAGGRRRRSQAARPLFGTQPPTAAWFHYAALTAALLGELERAVALLQRGHRRASARGARCTTTSPRSHERRGDYPSALRRPSAACSRTPGSPQLHKNLGDCTIAPARYDDALEATSAP